MGLRHYGRGIKVVSDVSSYYPDFLGLVTSGPDRQFRVSDYHFPASRRYEFVGMPILQCDIHFTASTKCEWTLRYILPYCLLLNIIHVLLQVFTNYDCNFELSQGYSHHSVSVRIYMYTVRYGVKWNCPLRHRSTHTHTMRNGRLNIQNCRPRIMVIW